MKYLPLILLSLSAPALARDACPAVYTPVCADRPGAVSQIFSNSCVAQNLGFKTRKGGATIQIRVAQDEEFWVYTTSKAAIVEARRLLKTGEQRVPLVTLADGADCNGNWTWHALPDSLSFNDITIELCDGTPSYVEANKEEWLKSVKTYCPWQAVVTQVVEQ